MTSLMVGLSFGSLAVQRIAILRTKSISSTTCLLFPTLGSNTSSSDLLSLIFILSHSTMSIDSPKSESNGLFPVRSSNKTTP
ncbi:hypothetical protein GmHk_03G008185 [Glycine max]|nr:hypothetical protein GmHk_03G008185 [Glycine max]